LNYIEENRDDYNFFYKDGCVYILRIKNYEVPFYLNCDIKSVKKYDVYNEYMLSIFIDGYSEMENFSYHVDNLKKHN